MIRWLFLLCFSSDLDLSAHLLKIGGEAVKVLIVRQQSVSLGAEEIVIPHSQQRQNNRDLREERKKTIT